MLRFKFYLVLFFLLVSCGDRNRQQKTKKTEHTDSLQNGKAAKQENNEDLKQFTSAEFNFELKYPKSWDVVTHTSGTQFPIINLVDKESKKELELPVSLHLKASISIISIFPNGYGTDLPACKSYTLNENGVDLNLNFEVNKAASYIFTLENGGVWGYILQPEPMPAKWENGFIFAQIATNDFSATCYNENGEKISMQACDPMTGDRITRSGKLNKDAKNTIAKILQSLKFKATNKSQQLSDLIKVDNPLPNQKINSPVKIKGKARGIWYFEGDFPIAIVDNEGNIIVESYATAKDEWMTEDFVPFEATITYDQPSVENGYMVFQRDNPSGLPENEMELRVPIRFENQ
jgi:hypothetical protein